MKEKKIPGRFVKNKKPDYFQAAVFQIGRKENSEIITKTLDHFHACLKYSINMKGDENPTKEKLLLHFTPSLTPARTSTCTVISDQLLRAVSKQIYNVDKYVDMSIALGVPQEEYNAVCTSESLLYNSVRTLNCHSFLSYSLSIRKSLTRQYP